MHTNGKKGGREEERKRERKREREKERKKGREKERKRGREEERKRGREGERKRERERERERERGREGACNEATAAKKIHREGKEDVQRLPPRATGGGAQAAYTERASTTDSC